MAPGSDSLNFAPIQALRTLYWGWHFGITDTAICPTRASIYCIRYIICKSEELAMSDNKKQATIYRMVMPKHICPFGLKALDLLKREGYDVDDNWLRTREETDEFMQKHSVETTPQIFIAGERIGGFDDLQRHLGKPVKDPDAVTYQPVIAVFATAILMAMAASWATLDSLLTGRTVEWFIAFSMCILA
nr:glutaredoxin domain-containing protein [Pseudomonas sp.]